MTSELNPADYVFYACVFFYAGKGEDGVLYEEEVSGPFDFDSAQSFVVSIAGTNPMVRRAVILTATEVAGGDE